MIPYLAIDSPQDPGYYCVGEKNVRDSDLERVSDCCHQPVFHPYAVDDANLERALEIACCECSCVCRIVLINSKGDVLELEDVG